MPFSISRLPFMDDDTARSYTGVICCLCSKAVMHTMIHADNIVTDQVSPREGVVDFNIYYLKKFRHLVVEPPNVTYAYLRVPDCFHLIFWSMILTQTTVSRDVKQLVWMRDRSTIQGKIGSQAVLHQVAPGIKDHQQIIVFVTCIEY